MEELKKLDSESIDCCITSPPYWGLRDYGTAKWEGGDITCEHKVGGATRGGLTDFQKANIGSFGDEAIRQGECCPHCGAIRIDAQLGLEKTPEEYVTKMVEVFREVKRVLKKEGTLWLNLGDTYYNFRGYTDYSTKQTCASNDAHKKNCASGKRNQKQDNLKGKDLVGIPWMTAFTLRTDGWYLRQDIIWHKPNPMPESVTDRCTKAHEYIFLLTKSQKYYFDNEAIKEEANYDGRKDEVFKGGVKYKGHQQQTMLSRGHERWKKDDNGTRIRNKRSVWTVTTKPFKSAHFATFPEDLILPCVLAGCPKGGTILDPFAGAGTTGVVAKKNNRNFIGIELNPKYVKMAQQRIDNTQESLF